MMCRAISAAVLVVLALPFFAWADRLILVAGGGKEKERASATTARLDSPFGVDFDKAGNMYIVELNGGRVLKVDDKGILTILAGTGEKGNAGDEGAGREATFNGMHSLAMGHDGILYLADTWNNRVRRLDPKTGRIRAFAGTGKKAYSGDGGPAEAAEFGGVFCIALSFDGSKLVLTDLDNRRIRPVDLKTGKVDLLAGNGKRGVPEDGADAKTAPLVDPRAACWDRKGNLYILERAGHALRVVDAKGKVRTVVGTGKAGLGLGEARKSQLNGPKHLCVDEKDNVIIADTANHRILRYLPGEEKVELIAGTGKKGFSGEGADPLKTSFYEPHGVTMHQEDGREVLYIVDSLNHRVFRLQKE